MAVLSGSMRQVALDFDELKKAVDHSPFLQSLTITGPKLSTDSHIWKLKGWKDNDGSYYEGHTVVGLPLGAQKGSDFLRGLGISILILDEFTLVPESSYQSLMPVGATSQNPMKDVLELEASSGFGRKAIWTPPAFDPAMNRLMYASTAYYEFSPAFQVFQRCQNNTALNIAAQGVLELLRGKYPNSTNEVGFRKGISGLLKYMPEELHKKYLPVTNEDHTSITDDLVLSLVDYLREYWHGRQYMAFQLSMEKAPKGWYKKQYLDSILPMMTRAEQRMEFYAEWQKDSDGIFPMSLLERATRDDIGVEMQGDGSHGYIIGVDPAESKKFAIVVIKLIEHPDDAVSAHVVYVREHDVAEEGFTHPRQVKAVYEILNHFQPCHAIVMDKGGGGAAIAATMALQAEPFPNLKTWGAFNKPVLTFEDETHGALKGEKLIWLLPMTNPMVTETNNRMVAAMQSGSLLFAGKLPKSPIEDAPFHDLRALKTQMSRLIATPTAGLQVKIDLPSKPTEPTHVHDLWSAFTQAYKGVVEFMEGNIIKKDTHEIPLGFWGDGTW